MRYLPKSPADRASMLEAIGAATTDDLFAAIPPEYRLNRDLRIPRQMAESEILDWFRERIARSRAIEPKDAAPLLAWRERMCGAIRYSATANPANSMVCHCQSCRRSAASPVVAWVTFAKSEFKFTRGTPRICAIAQSDP